LKFKLKGLDANQCRVFGSAGEASNIDDDLWLSSRADYKPIIELCGSTELAGGYIHGTLLQPQAFAAVLLRVPFHMLFGFYLPCCQNFWIIIVTSHQAIWQFSEYCFISRHCVLERDAKCVNVLVGELLLYLGRRHP